MILIGSDALSFTNLTTLALPEAQALTVLDVPALKPNRAAGLVTRRSGWLSPAALGIIDVLKARALQVRAN